MNPAPEAGADSASLQDLPWAWLAPALAVAASAVMMSTVFRHELRHDDFVQCFEAVHYPLWTFLWMPYGGHILPLHRIVYAVFQPIFGLTAFPYFAVAFVTHLANVYLLYRILFHITHREKWSAFWAGLWGASLPAVGTLILFSTYGQAEAGFFALLVLNDLLAFRDRGETPGSGRVSLWALSLLLSAFSAGIGTSTAFGIYVCAALMFRGAGARRAAGQVFLVALGIFLFYTWLQRQKGDVTAFDPKLIGFSFEAFLLICAQGVANLFVPAVFSVADGAATMGPLRHQSAWVMGAMTVGVALVMISALVLGVRAASLERRRAWTALTAVALGNYALIAIGRSVPVHVFGGTPQSLAQAIRYHYFNLAFVTCSFAVGLSEWKWLHERLSRRAVGQAIAGWALAAFVTSFGAAQEITREDSEQARTARRELRQKVKAAARAVPVGATAYVPNDPYPPTQFMFAVGVPPSRFPHSAAAWLCDGGDEQVLGRTIRFVEHDVTLLRTLRQERDSPINRLLVDSATTGKTSPAVLTLGEPGARTRVLRGIYDEDEKGYAWSARVFAVVLGVTPDMAARGGVLRVSGYVSDAVIAQNKRVVLDAKLASTALPTRTVDNSGLVDVDFDVPPGAIAPGDVDVEITLEKAFVAPTDDRELGILVHRFEFVPR